jgi:hypothetical protein
MVDKTIEDEEIKQCKHRHICKYVDCVVDNVLCREELKLICKYFEPELAKPVIPITTDTVYINYTLECEHKWEMVSNIPTTGGWEYICMKCGKHEWVPPYYDRFTYTNNPIWPQGASTN